jgi:hypothetical protein
MPFLEDEPITLGRKHDVPKGFAVTPGAADLDGPDKPSWNWGAAFRRDNEIAALAASEGAWIGNDPEPGFNPWDKIKGTPDEANFARLAEARNEQKLNAIRADIARENEDRKLTDSQPWWMGMITGGAASILSPTTLIPGGAFVKGAKGGISLVKPGWGRVAVESAKTGARMSGAAGVSTGLQEVALHNIQETRTLEDSAWNIGGSMFLTGIIGSAGVKVFG